MNYIYNIIIFGTGSTAERLSKNLNSNINILCYLDNDDKKWGNKFKGKLILEPKEINNLKYDYVVIASQFNSDIFSQLIKYGVSSCKIFEYLDFLNNVYNPFEYKINLFEQNYLDYEVLITGISYFVTGIDENILDKKGINFAFDSQDLYYDYSISKYLLENYNTNIRYAIIGLNYYSFQYDLSLSSMKDNIKLYYPKLKKSNNFDLKENNYNRLVINKNIANKILIINNNNGKYKLNNVLIPLAQQKNLYEVGRNQAELDCNKNYPQTVKKNKIILKKYLDLLKECNIAPIIVICPTSKYYYENFSERIRNEFFQIINEIKKEYDFQYIDYFKSKLFDDNMFYDVSHLTYEGGKKFTNILNRVIKW
ncbi:D-alanyl-lipoteichoic acid biosynthesis protein DltD [Clostridium sp. CH2]|uniref:nucleoside-diphosphate sugar epimerase/dehydratase n=1 Tax=Clostridium sp. CH2 TaxID=2949990 RepID=UPI00207AE6D9